MEQFNFYLGHCTDELGRHSTFPNYIDVDIDEGGMLHTVQDSDDPFGYDNLGTPAFKDLAPEYQDEYYFTNEYGELVRTNY